jgi:hypothetical protein
MVELTVGKIVQKKKFQNVDIFEKVCFRDFLEVTALSDKDKRRWMPWRTVPSFGGFSGTDSGGRSPFGGSQPDALGANESKCFELQWVYTT